MKKKILMITEDYNLPLINGARLRSWNFIRALSREHDLYLLNIHEEDRGPEYRPLLDDPAFRRVWMVPRLRIREELYKSLPKRLLTLARGIPWEFKDLDRQPEIDAALGRILSGYRFDYIFARYIKQARYLTKHRRSIRGRVIVDLDDIETRKSQRWMEKEGYRGLYDRFRKQINVKVFEQYHRRFLKSVDCCILCSREDREYLLGKRWARNIAVVPNTVAVDSAPLQPLLPEKEILFVGTLAYTPNAEGIVWFAKEILPKIKAREPDAKLNIVGSRPYPHVLALAGPDVIIHKNVSDEEMVSFYQQAGVVIVPIRIAAGTRIKILEAALHMRPVVTTTLGGEGLELEAGRHCLIADDEESFAQACLNVLADKDLAGRLAEECYRHVNERYGFETVAKKILEVFR